MGWMLESEPYCATTTAIFQHVVCSWTLVEPGCLLVCSGLSLKHSSDMQRRRQLKLQAFPTINEQKSKCIILLSSSECAAWGIMFTVKKGAGEGAGTVTDSDHR